MTSTFVHYVGNTPLTQTDAFQRVAEATAERKRRREGWLRERKEKLRERFHHNVIEKALKRQTERCAARRSGDPTLAAGRRLQAKINADVRKAGVVTLLPNAPVKLRMPSVISMPIAELRAHKGVHFDCSEVGKEKSVLWHYKGKQYTHPQLKKALDYEQKIRMIADAKLKSRKTLQKSMDKLQTNLQESAALRLKGVNANLELKIAHGTQTLPRSRLLSIHGWIHPNSMLALANDHREKEAYYHRPSVIARSQPQAAPGFALPPAQPDEPMDLDKHKFEEWRIDQPSDFQMPTVEQVNAEPLDSFTEALKHMAHQLLVSIKNHLTGLRRDNGGEGISNPKWLALIGAISEAHQKENQGKKKNGNNSNNSNRGNGKNSRGQNQQSNYNNQKGGKGNQNNQQNGKGNNNQQNNRNNNNNKQNNNNQQNSRNNSNNNNRNNNNSNNNNNSQGNGNNKFQNGKKGGKSNFVPDMNVPMADTSNYGTGGIN